MIDMIDNAIGNINESPDIDLNTNTPLASLIDSANSIATDGGDTPIVANTIDAKDRALDRENNPIGWSPI